MAKDKTMTVSEEELDDFARKLVTRLEFILVNLDDDDPAKITPQKGDEKAIRRRYGKLREEEG